VHILHVVGARPNFMKAAPVMSALAARGGTRQTLVHTGQHYDANMSRVFFRELSLPTPDVNLEVGSGSHVAQTAEIMRRFEPAVLQNDPDLVLVYGDVNSTLAAALVCAKLAVPVGHVEAGLRSFDRAMPEEMNRLLTDQIADLLFTPSADGDENLQREGVAAKRIHCVGNVMVDTLVRMLPQAQALWSDVRSHLGLGGQYGLVTLHRPANVDDSDCLCALVRALVELSDSLPMVFPVHPRTRKRLQKLHLEKVPPGLRLISPLGYVQFLALEKHACFVVTDSGGIQEETTFLGVPCLTMRENTERPVTLDQGTNMLVGRDVRLLRENVRRILGGDTKHGRIPELWDGRSGARIAEVIDRWRRTDCSRIRRNCS